MTTSMNASPFARRLRAALFLAGAFALSGGGCAATRLQARPAAPPSYDIDVAPIDASFALHEDLRRRLDGIVTVAMSSTGPRLPTDAGHGVLKTTIARSSHRALVVGGLGNLATTFDYNTYVVQVTLVNPLGIDAGTAEVELDADAGELRADRRAEGRALERALRRALQALLPRQQRPPAAAYTAFASGPTPRRQ